MNQKSIGLVELSSVAAGFQAADTMLKAGNVHYTPEGYERIAVQVAAVIEQALPK